MLARIDVKNSKTNNVISLQLSVIDYDNSKDSYCFDILVLKENEMFFINNEQSPYFGPDYNVIIKDNRLYAHNIWKRD